MTKEKILEKLLKIEPAIGHNYELYQDLVDALKQDIRDENNKKAGKSNTARLAKAIFKSAPESQKKMQYAHTEDGIQFVLDGYRIAGFYRPMDLPEWTETPDWFNIKHMLDVELNPEPLKLPTIGEIKAEIKIAKASNPKFWKCLYVFENGTGVNAQYLLDFMQGFGESMKIYEYDNFSTKYPLWIEADDGFGLLLPVYHYEDKPGFHHS